MSFIRSLAVFVLVIAAGHASENITKLMPEELIGHWGKLVKVGDNPPYLIPEYTVEQTSWEPRSPVGRAMLGKMIVTRDQNGSLTHISIRESTSCTYEIDVAGTKLVVTTRDTASGHLLEPPETLYVF